MATSLGRPSTLSCQAITLWLIPRPMHWYICASQNWLLAVCKYFCSQHLWFLSGHKSCNLASLVLHVSYNNHSSCKTPKHCFVVMQQVGMAALLAAVCSVPLTSVLLLFELTKDYHILLPLMVRPLILVPFT
jgi:hypothetical protein